MKPVIKFKIKNKTMLFVKLSEDIDDDGIFEKHTDNMIQVEKGQVVNIFVKDRKKKK